MANEPIVINAEFLRRLVTKYTGDVDEIDRMHGKIYEYGTLPGSKVDITRPFALRLGGRGFDEAVDMTRRLDAVRSGLAERFKNARRELYNLEHGIKFLLDDSEAVEQLSTL